MNETQFWKNFRLGEELHIAGAFIYDGLRRFYELQSLDYSDELFEFLYSLSVGLERLLKITVVLYEHTEATDQGKLEKSLITHNHLDLLSRLQSHVKIKFGKPQYDLFQCLSRFYKTLRYDRFSLRSVYQGEKEAIEIRRLLNKHLGARLKESGLLIGNSNEDRYREFIARTVRKISATLYQAVIDKASGLGLYTGELRHGSKAESVFLREVRISDEEVLWKELLIFFMNAKANTGYMNFLREIDPLEFDPALVSDYLDCFKSHALKATVMDELESLYDDLDPKVRHQRFQTMTIIASPGVYFDEPEAEDDAHEPGDGSAY